MATELLKVGDKLHTTTMLGTNWFRITRVTRTLAFSKREKDGYEHKFKRFISGDMSHPSRQYNTITYTVERK